VLSALLVGVSQHLLDGGTRVATEAADPASALRSLIAFHVDFALGEPDTIRVQDHDLDALAEDQRRAVRRLQRRYIELWMEVLAELHPSLSTVERRMRVQATFGLINSTPHSARVGGTSVDASAARPVLEQMAWAGLNAH
jgi:hypothetical protein